MWSGELKLTEVIPQFNMKDFFSKTNYCRVISFQKMYVQVFKENWKFSQVNTCNDNSFKLSCRLGSMSFVN